MYICLIALGITKGSTQANLIVYTETPREARVRGVNS